MTDWDYDDDEIKRSVYEEDYEELTGESWEGSDEDLYATVDNIQFHGVGDGGGCGCAIILVLLISSLTLLSMQFLLCYLL